MEKSLGKTRWCLLHLPWKLSKRDRVCKRCEQIHKMASYARLQSPLTCLFSGNEKEQNKKLYWTIQKMLYKVIIQWEIAQYLRSYTFEQDQHQLAWNCADYLRNDRRLSHLNQEKLKNNIWHFWLQILLGRYQDSAWKLTSIFHFTSITVNLQSSLHFFQWIYFVTYLLFTQQTLLQTFLQLVF